jgi:diguanylate cyclase (GGDEF)-like protein/PAS domain S-box-containing protein
VNSAGAELLGYHPDQLVGAQMHSLVHARHADGSPYALEDCPIHQGLRTGTAVRANEEIFFRADGRAMPVEFRSQPIMEDGTLTGAVVNFTDISERKAFEAELAHQSLHDALTGLPNRLLLLDRLERALVARARHGGELAVLGLDLDRFKVVNDSLGHSAGDELLVEVGHRLVGALRETDTVARFGGDEFVVVCEHLDGEHAASAVAERLLAAFADPIRIRDRDISLTTSIGIAYAHEGAQPQELLRTADLAMYRAKEQGGDRAAVFDEAMSQRVVARLELEADLHRALQHSELRVFYQPVMDLHTDRAIGVEALVRWEHPQRGLVSPAEFIPIAEETGLIVPLGAWVMTEACRQAAEWRRAHLAAAHLTVAVNVSARQFSDTDLVAAVRHALGSSGLPPHALCLEVTESTVMQDADASARILRELTLLGVTISVDDFGTGYSSMAQLKSLPVDTLKIDRAFVSGLDHNAEDRAIVTAILSLARALGLDVIAEGVERAEQGVELRQLGCRAAQGFRWSRPLPPDETMQWITGYAASPTGHDTAGQAVGRYRIVVVDDNEEHRALIRRVLERNGSFDIVAEGADGQAAIRLSGLHQPDLLLLDRRLPDIDADEALPQIHDTAPTTRVVLFSGTVPTVIPHGVSATLEKGGAPHQLINVLLEVASRPSTGSPLPRRRNTHPAGGRSETG